MSQQILNNGETLGTIRGKINTNSTELYETKVGHSEVLTKTNITPYSPTAPYHPATKLYVDDLYGSWQAIYDPTNINADIFNRSNHYGQITPATVATDAANRFVSDAEKADWNQKEDGIGAKGTAFNKNFGTLAGTVASGDHHHDTQYEPASSNIQTHIGTTLGNPHNVTKSEVGLANVDNTSDIDKPISTAQQTALDGKIDTADPQFDSGKVGDFVGGDYTDFDEDGTMTAHGAATCYDDLWGDLTGARLTVGIGQVDLDWFENCVKWQPNSTGNALTDEDHFVITNLQYPHKSVATGSLDPHIHFKHVDGGPDATFSIMYRVQSNGQLAASSWTTITATVSTDCVFSAPGTGETKVNILQFPSIDMTGKGISAVVMFRIARTDNNTGDINACMFDCHYEIDMMGSGEPYVK